MSHDPTIEKYGRGPVSDHFDGLRFFNPWNRHGKKGFWDMLKWRWQAEGPAWPAFAENAPRPPVCPAGPGRVRVTYIGHATMLVDFHGCTVLIDPVFSQRVSPFRAAGPKRVRPPFVSIEDLPPVDAVFVSHNHYDHLDLPSLSWLARHRHPVFVTPLGNPRLIRPIAQDCPVIGLDWHQSCDLGKDVRLTILPAQHWSRRGLNDINRDLWGGCLLERPGGGSVFYTGDSGFHEDLYRGLRNRYGAPSIALLPIGAYEPRWFMGYAHMAPDEAVALFNILSPEKAMAFHFETFHLTDEGFGEPRQKLAEACQKAGLSKGRFIAPYPGDVIEI